MNVKNIFSKNYETWKHVEVEPEKIDKLSQKLNLDRLLGKVLLHWDVGKGDFKEIQKFIRPPKSYCFNYENISEKSHLKKALQRVAKALKNKEPIVINGDPDADGITSTTVVVAALRYFGGQVTYDFPVRAKEGHGFQPRIIDQAKEKGAKLIITTDCGTKDIVATEYANSFKIDVIICDHHILGKRMPDAVAMVNPHLVKKDTPNKGLSGSGVAYKFMIALSEYLKEPFLDEVADYLICIAALGMIADRVSLLEPVNRAMISEGVNALNRAKVMGLRALREISVGHSGIVRPRYISRTIVPRLNSPGRIGDPQLGIPDSKMVVDLLLTGLEEVEKKSKKGRKKYMQKFYNIFDFQRSDEIVEKTYSSGSAGDKAESVEKVNEERRKITEKIESEIEVILQKKVDILKDRVIIVKGIDWNSGVIGIDADRLRERFKRPVIILTQYTGQEYMKGSCRSMPKINMYAILEKVQDSFLQDYNENIFQAEVPTETGMKLINAFGGHAQACGFTLHEKNYNEFIERVRKEVDKLSEDDFRFSYNIIKELSFSQINTELIAKLEKLSPYGDGFENPLFLLRNCRLGLRPRPFGNKYQETRTLHVEFAILSPVKSKAKMIRHNTLIAIGFGLWEKYQEVVAKKNNSMTYDVIFQIEVQYKGNKPNRIRLLVYDIRKS